VFLHHHRHQCNVTFDGWLVWYSVNVDSINLYAFYYNYLYWTWIFQTSVLSAPCYQDYAIKKSLCRWQVLHYSGFGSAHVSHLYDLLRSTNPPCSYHSVYFVLQCHNSLRWETSSLCSKALRTSLPRPITSGRLLVPSLIIVLRCKTCVWVNAICNWPQGLLFIDLKIKLQNLSDRLWAKLLCKNIMCYMHVVFDNVYFPS